MKKFYIVRQDQKEMFFAKLKLGREWMPEVISNNDMNHLTEVYGVDSVGEAKDLSKEQQIDFALAKRLIMVNPQGPDNEFFRKSLKAETKKKSTKEPTKKEMEIYKYYNVLGKTQTEFAGIASKQYNEKITQDAVSRLIKKVKAWLEYHGLPAEKKAKLNSVTVDPARLDLGNRTDGHRPGDPRKAKLQDAD